VARDDDGWLSGTAALNVEVKAGAPRVASVAADTAWTQIYVRDQRRFIIKGSDPNNELDSIMVSWDGGTVFEAKKTAGDSTVFVKTFARADSGSRGMMVRVRDADGQTSDSTIGVTVKAGWPAVTWQGVDTTGDNIFVKDSRAYHVRASDANGIISRIYANWEGGNTAQTTISVDPGRASIDTFFTHEYDTTAGGMEKSARFWSMDDDSLMSARYDSTVTVRLGAPRVWGDTPDAEGDTVFLVCLKIEDIKTW